MCKNFAPFCLALYLIAALYGQESPSQSKPVVPESPYSLMGLVPGESKADAVIALTKIWNAQENAAFGKFVKSHHKDAWPPPLPFNCTAYTVSGKQVDGTELCYSEITLTVRELYYETPNPIQIFYLTFVDNYLEAVEYDFLRASFGETVQALGEKYGPAMTVNHVTLQNGFGAQFDCAEYTWDNGISSITARQYNPLAESVANSLLNDESIVKVRNKALFAEYLKRAAANGPKI